MSYLDSSFTAVIVGPITKDGAKDLENDRVRITVVLKNKRKGYDNQTIFANCYFNKGRIERVREYLTQGRIVSIVGEYSFTSINKEKDSRNVDINGLNLQLIDNPFKEQPQTPHNPFKPNDKIDDVPF